MAQPGCSDPGKIKLLCGPLVHMYYLNSMHTQLDVPPSVFILCVCLLVLMYALERLPIRVI